MQVIVRASSRGFSSYYWVYTRRDDGTITDHWGFDTLRKAEVFAQQLAGLSPTLHIDDDGLGQTSSIDFYEGGTL